MAKMRAAKKTRGAGTVSIAAPYTLGEMPLAAQSLASKAKTNRSLSTGRGEGISGRTTTSHTDSMAEKISHFEEGQPSGATRGQQIAQRVRDEQLLKQQREDLERRELLMAERESKVGEREREARMAAHRRPSFPEDMYEMQHLVHRAPRFWHLHTLVTVILQKLIRAANMGPEERTNAAHIALAQIAKSVRTTPKDKSPAWLLKAMEHPVFRKVWDAPPPRRTRGGTGDNKSTQAIFTFTELAMLAYDKHLQWEFPHLSLKELYSGPAKYVKGFLPFAKKRWEDGGREGAEALTEGKVRTNQGDKKSGKPKRSFGLFKDQVSNIALRNLANWRTAYPP